MAIIHLHLEMDTSKESLNDVLKGFALQASQARALAPSKQTVWPDCKEAKTTEQPAENPTAAPAPSYPSSFEIREFLNSDDRYEYRTMKAIVKHFEGEYSEDAVRQAVEGMANNYSLETATRIRDGVRLYATI